MSWVACGPLCVLCALCVLCVFPVEDHPWRQFPLRIDRGFDGLHLLDSFAAVKIAQQLLLDRVATDTMLGERRSAVADGFAADGEYRLAAGGEIADPVRDDVRMQVAGGDVAPRGRVQLPALELPRGEREQLVQPVERNNHVRGRLRDACIDGPLRLS